MDLITHPRTETQLDNYLKRPSHGLILAGDDGVGKYYTAKWLAQKLGRTSYTIEPIDDKHTISIEQIRDLYNLTKTGSEVVIIIKDAQTMGIEAQNAFLKLLEEPPKNTNFILTSSNATALLPTIISRTQVIIVIPPKSTDLLKYLRDKTELNDEQLQSLLLTTSNRVGKLISLINEPEELESHNNVVEDAKQFYVSDQYDRHKMCATHDFDKDWLKNMLDILATIIQTLIKQNHDKPTVLSRLTHQSKLIESTFKSLFEIPGNPKIQLSKLISSL